MRSALELAADRLYQKEKRLFLATIKFVDESAGLSDLPAAELMRRKEKLILFAGHAIYPIIESFPSEVAKTIVIPEYISALDSLSRKHEVETLDDFDVQSEEYQLVAFFLLQEATTYSEYLLHDDRGIVSHYRRLLSEIIVKLRRGSLSCEDIFSLERLTPIRDALTNTVDIDRTEGVVVMIEDIFTYLTKLEQSMNCEDIRDDS